MIKKIMPFISVLMAAAFVALLIWGQKTDQQTNQSLSEVHTSVQDLEEQLAELKAQLEQLDTQPVGTGTLEYLFPEPAEQLFTDVFPVMEEYGYHGTVLLSPEKFPGDPDCISWDQYHEMKNSGWAFSLSCPNASELEDWYAAVTRRLNSNLMDQPQCIYFSNSDYNTSLDSALSSMGFTVAIHHGENELPIMVTEDEEELWHPGVSAAGYDGMAADIETAVNTGANLIFVSGFSDTDSVPFEEERFRQVLDTVSSYVNEEKLNVTNPVSARILHQEEKKELASSGVSQEAAEIQEQIDSLQEQIDQSYESWKN